MASSFSVGQISVGDTATQIVAQNTSRHHVTIQNSGSTLVYIGPNKNVTTSTGFLLPANGSCEIPSTSAIWGVVGTGSETVSFLDV